MICLRGLAFAVAVLTFSMAAHAAESTASPKMVTCTDGTQSQDGQGACSHHGGVKPAHKMVTCTDGTKSEAGQGACSHHGGVKPKAATTASKPAKPTDASGTTGEPSGGKDED